MSAGEWKTKSLKLAKDSRHASLSAVFVVLIIKPSPSSWKSNLHNVCLNLVGDEAFCCTPSTEPFKLYGYRK
ncbi:hypothetical protein IQ07DRAFT_247389 [Pyrenochaeta sp. DS3sAY3a]|nr:hypothetical protein IQ07DRAFT_247389 [Pyrenochaeta sp. DS3sAY3a]